jgi:predicted O-methyltransferase YrrM
MGIHPEDLEHWLRTRAAPSDEILRRAGEEGRRRGFPIVGPQVGRLLEQLARGWSARRIFELGSGFGYSTLWFCRALPPDGVIHHTEGDPANSARARELLTEAGHVDRVRFHVGDALHILETLEDREPFDILFCDVDKHQYPAAWRLMAERVRTGGIIVTDNLVWGGAVADPAAGDPETEGIREYCRLAWSDGRFLSSLMPVRDGVGLHLRLA